MVFVRNESVSSMDECFCISEFLMCRVMGHVVKISIGIREFFVDASE